jgi:hypothetical protein
METEGNQEGKKDEKNIRPTTEDLCICITHRCRVALQNSWRGLWFHGLRDEARFAGWVARPTLILCIVGVFQVWAFIQSERAFVAVSAADFAASKIWGVKFLPMSVTLNNGGKSTAEIEDIAAAIAHELRPIPWYGEAAKFAFPPITPGGTNTRVLRFDNGGETGWPENIPDEIRTGKRRFYIYALVKYRDDFSWSIFAPKETGFCFAYIPESGLSPQGGSLPSFQTCPEKAYTYAK